MKSAHRVPYARAGGERRQKRFDLFARRGDGGLQIHRHECRERHALRHGAAGGHGLLVVGFEQLPVRRFAVFGARGVNRLDAQGRPQLGQGAQRGALGQVAAQLVFELVGGVRAVAVQQLPYLGHQRRALAARTAAPLPVAAQGKHEGQGFLGREEIRLVAGAAQQVQRNRIGCAGGRSQHPAQQA